MSEPMRLGRPPRSALISSTHWANGLAVTVAVRPFDRQAHVDDQGIGPRVGHPAGLLGVEDIRGSSAGPSAWASATHSTSRMITHPRLFQVLPEMAVDQADGREVLDSGEPEARSTP